MKKKVWTKEQSLHHLNTGIEKVEGELPTPCWEWQGSLTRDGYGQFSQMGAHHLTGQKLTHRAMYALTHDFEFTSRNQQVMHRCHNRRCCNPDHLKLGTAKENIAEAIARGTWSPCTKVGEDNPVAKLTEADVRAMRALRADFGCTYVLLGQMFGVTTTTAQDATKGNTWRHVK